MIVSKRTHYLTLLLSTYYVFYGPEQYYELFDQERLDRVTRRLTWPRLALLDYLFTRSASRWRIEITPPANGGVLGVSMLQADPIEDYQLTSNGKCRVRFKKKKVNLM